ncbi:MAG: NAD(P)/FAD-dependent oxidoreductase [Actinomycetota bacterium]
MNLTEDRVLVIGAGAAGLAAARRLHDEGQAVTVLEARDRVGGRAHSSFDIATHPVELGAEFVHGENVCTWELLERFGLNAIDIHARLNFLAYIDGRLLDQASFLRTPSAALLFKTAYAAKSWIDNGGGDLSLTAAASQGAGFFDEDPTSEERRFWNNLTAQLQAADLEDVGVGGIAEATHDGDGGQILFRVAEGYSTLMDALASGIDVRLGSAVERIEWSEAGVTVFCEGERFEARQAIVTLPLAILQEDDVAFDPPLGSEKVSAIRGLGAGPIAKIVLRFDRRFWPEGMTNLLTTLDSQGWWTPGAGRDDEAPVLTALLGGSAVRRLQALDEPAVEGLRDLERVFDMSLHDRLVEARWIDWSCDPWSKMGYSYVPPGGVGLRDVLAAPVADVLFFAGEATNAIRPASIHGAFESGYRAAREVRAVTAKAKA